MGRPVFFDRVRRARWVLLFAASAATALVYALPKPPTLCLDDANGCQPVVSSGTYPLYPAFDLNQIPWHTGSGAWGPQVRIQAPAVPVTTRSVTVNSRTEFNTAAAVAGTRITIATGWAGNTVATINASDVDVIIPAGVSIGAVEMGSWPRATAIVRVRIRGPVPGTHSGGRMGQFRDFNLVTDVILDGIDINGDSGFGPGETYQALRVGATRMAILNSRIIAPGYLLLGGARHLFIGNTNMYHGASPRSQVGFVEGWGIRNGAGPITIVDSRIQGTRYHNLRPQSEGGTGELLYVGRSTLVGVAEGRTAWMWNNLGAGGNAPNANGQGAIIENSNIYSYAAPGCGFGEEINAMNVTFSRIRNNRFFGGGTAVFTQSGLDSAAAQGATGSHDWTVGNTFAPLTALPAWGGPGDPTQVPLPAGMTLITGEGSCPSF